MFSARPIAAATFNVLQAEHLDVGFMLSGFRRWQFFCQLPVRVPELLPRNKVSQRPVRVPERVPQRTSEHLQGRVPERVPERVSERPSERVPERASECAPGRAPGHVSRMATPLVVPR